MATKLKKLSKAGLRELIELAVQYDRNAKADSEIGATMRPGLADRVSAICWEVRDSIQQQIAELTGLNETEVQALLGEPTGCPGFEFSGLGCECETLEQHIGLRG